MRSSCEGIFDYIVSGYDSAVEIGIGHYPDVGLALLKKGIHVFATDIIPFHHDGIEIFVDDISHPDLSLYSGIQIMYAIRPPLELVPYMKRVAKEVNADLIVKLLSSECPGGVLNGRGRTAFFLWRRL